MGSRRPELGVSEVSGLVLLAVMALLSTCYAMVGTFVSIRGDRRLPRFLVAFLRPTTHPSGSIIGRAGSLLVGGVWLAIGVAPQVALARELLAARTSWIETVAVLFSLAGSAAWVAYLGWRYR